MSTPENSGNANQSYLSKLSPWSKPPTTPPQKSQTWEPEPALQQQKRSDHVINHRHRLSLRKYPPDCPPVRPCWFHAVDIPKRRPRPTSEQSATEEKPPGTPKKYAAFSTRDSKAVEAAFQKLIEIDEANSGRPRTTSLEDHSRADLGTKNSKDDLKPGRIRVPVNEDYLFDVDVDRRELAPAYWQGPVYSVRRGTWFYQDGNVQRPCDENLAAQLEEGYLKVKAWRIPSSQSASRERAASETRSRQRPTSWAPNQDTNKGKMAAQLTQQSSEKNLRNRAANSATPGAVAQSDCDSSDNLQTTYRLFGAHMNSVVTYQDGKTAWLLTDDFMSRMSSTMYQRFAGGGHFAGVKLTRGYVHLKHKESQDEKVTQEKLENVKAQAPTAIETQNEEADGIQSVPSPSEARRMTLERQMSSLFEDPSPEDAGKQEQERQRRERQEIEDDYREAEGDDQDREVEHLLLVTHGIGQRLGLRLESVNFVQDVNLLRKTLKAVYADSPDLRALNAELGNTETVNSRIQVLPICWRHLLDFPKQSLKHNRKELDIADSDIDEVNFPSLDDITVEGVPAVRNLICDLALDILLYQAPAYKDHLTRIVLSECNRIYHLFKERNPNFNGKVSMVGHSLGSAIMFDILCRQGQSPHETKAKRREQRQMTLDFDVDSFYALGSPIGLFQMLKGRNVVSRQQAESRKHAFSTSMDDPMFDTPVARSNVDMSSNAALTDNDIPVSSPKCSQIYNIFHPTDPISYRLEPLISPAMASLKPQPLPYTKRGIFGAPMGQGLSGIGTRVSQSVSSMWNSMASNLLTRGLGYSGDDSHKGVASQAPKTSAPLSLGASTKATAGATAVLPTMPDKRLEQLANQTIVAGEQGTHPPTLIDAEIETLSGGFEKRRKSAQSDAELRDLGAGATKNTPEWAEAEDRARKLRREEDKVRRLNSNGRVDYAIQEGVFDINLIAAIASHLSYWSDEDVSHFIISQLLSRQRVVRTPPMRR